MHPIVRAAESLPADQGQAAVREAAQVDALLAATEALDADNAIAERQLLRAAAAVGDLYNTYACYDGSGAVAKWYFKTLRTLQARASARFSAKRSRELVHVPWELLETRRGGR
jgi:hypothetical protein